MQINMQKDKNLGEGVFFFLRKSFYNILNSFANYLYLLNNANFGNAS